MAAPFFRAFLLLFFVLPAANLSVWASPDSQSVSANRAHKGGKGKPAATLTLPVQLVEGETPGNNATLNLSKATSKAAFYTLSASPENELIMPTIVKVPA